MEAARLALDGPWAHLTATERGRLLGRLADLVDDNAETLATIEAWDCGECDTGRLIPVSNADY